MHECEVTHSEMLNPEKIHIFTSEESEGCDDGPRDLTEWTS